MPEEGTRVLEGQWILHDSLRNLLLEAWMDGFGSSGEGVNGEYPYGDKGIDVHTCPTLLRKFNEFLSRATPCLSQKQ